MIDSSPTSPAAAAPIRLLVFSTLFPNAVQPSHGVFVENRLRHLLADGSVTAEVIAPVPWFPSAGRMFGRYSIFTKIAAQETRSGVTVRHPRYAVIPHIGMSLAPFLLYAAARRVVTRLFAEGHRFDLIDAHYFYPDGVAAAMLGRRLGLPVTITARGSDVNLISDFILPRRMVRWAAEQADGLIAVSDALAKKMSGIGIDSTKITVLRNGVDLATFHPIPRDAARRQLQIAGPTLISVGNLLMSKGQNIAIRALPMLPNCRLLLVGDGSDRAKFERLAGSLGVGDRVRFIGRVHHADLARYYAAADILVLPSVREGWPNVLLESMACGTPVIASSVGGIPEIITVPAAGRLMTERTPEALAEAARELLDDPPPRSATRAYAEGFSWDATTRGQKVLFSRILAERSGAPS
jgi:glycosyltransferase involved in cell wall biosynthesis